MKKMVLLLLSCFLCLYLAGCATVATTAAPDPGLRRIAYFSSARRISARLILPPRVLGSSSTYSMTRGYL